MHDSLKFFIGDHPAQQFERGTQQGGSGGCGARDVMFSDLHDLQTVATAGKFGKQANQNHLKILELQKSSKNCMHDVTTTMIQNR